MPEPTRAGRGLVALAVFATCVLGAASCRSGTAPVATAHPLVLVAVDGLEWRLVLDMMRDGKLPAIGELLQNGASARLTTLEPALSPPIWTSIATGVLPQRHGILGFTRPDVRTADGEPVMFTNRERRVKALWNILGDAGISSCVVGYWMTFPVERMRGVMVAQTGSLPGERTRKGGLVPARSGQVEPAELEERIFRVAADASKTVPARAQQVYGDAAGWPPAMQQVVEHSRWSLAADAAYERIALDLVAEPGRCDVVIVYLGLADVLGHRFWRWTYPQDFQSPPPADEIERFGGVLRNAYEGIDAFVGEMRRAAGPLATVIVASDHGMGPWRPNARVDVSRPDGPLVRTGGHSARRDAIFVGAGPGLAQTAAAPAAATSALPEAGSILDMTPTLLALVGLPRGADMDGHVLGAVLDKSFLASHPLKEIATHTPDGWAATRTLADAEDPNGSERIEQLRALGYLQ